MQPFCAVVFCVLLKCSLGDDLSFPPNFKFGAATSAHQIEGGWNSDGKGESIWDRFTHQYPDRILNKSTGDVAADSYHFWREDVKAAAQLKLQFYRFSISWTRILPTGFTNEFNEAGAKYYSDLIDGLLAEGIEPMVTLYHWDLPGKIQDLGGWTNPLIVKWFGNYARVIFSLYADRVKTWLTLNEPISVCDYLYSSGLGAPGIADLDYAPYLCNKHMMLAHATAYRIFEQEFRPWRKGRISLANHILWLEPVTPDDKLLADLAIEHQVGRYTHPIFSKEGGWPPSIEKYMLEISRKEGYKESRLPSFTEEEKQFVKGTADFFGLNYYSTNLIRPAARGEEADGLFSTIGRDFNATLLLTPGKTFGYKPEFSIFPEGFRKTLSWLKRQFGDIDILVTENGLSSTENERKDYERIGYIMKHLEQILLSIKLDKVNVIGYTVWSLIDNFEWLGGYGTQFGVYEVDYNHPNLTRTPRLSAQYYKCVIERRSLDVPASCWNKHIGILDSADTHKMAKVTQQTSDIVRRLHLSLNLTFN